MPEYIHGALLGTASLAPIPRYADVADRDANNPTPQDGDQALTLNDDTLWEYDVGTTAWVSLGAAGSVHTHVNKPSLDLVSGTNTGNEVQATEIVAGVTQIATAAQVSAGIDDTTTVTPLKLQGALVATIAAVSATGNIAATTDIELVDASAAQVTRTLPTAIGSSGRIITVKRMNSGVNQVIVDSLGGTVEGGTSVTLTAQYSLVVLVSDGTNWWIVG